MKISNIVLILSALILLIQSGLISSEADLTRFVDNVDNIDNVDNADY